MRLADLHPYGRWRYVLEKTKVRYREPYKARHSYIGWRLMSGANLLLVAKEDGHSTQTMLSTYAAWTEDATQADVEIVRKAMEHSPHVLPACADSSAANPLGDPGTCHQFAGRGRVGTPELAKIFTKKCRTRTGSSMSTKTVDGKQDVSLKHFPLYPGHSPRALVL
jgi:hypothetical protein